jgi:hypothetical protein
MIQTRYIVSLGYGTEMCGPVMWLAKLRVKEFTVFFWENLSENVHVEYRKGDEDNSRIDLMVGLWGWEMDGTGPDGDHWQALC